MKKETNNWEKEFDKLFKDFPTSAHWYFQVKSFISTLLTQQKREAFKQGLESCITDRSTDLEGKTLYVSEKSEEDIKKELLEKMIKALEEVIEKEYGEGEEATKRIMAIFKNKKLIRP